MFEKTQIELYIDKMILNNLKNDFPVGSHEYVYFNAKLAEMKTKILKK